MTATAVEKGNRISILTGAHQIESVAPTLVMIAAPRFHAFINNEGRRIVSAVMKRLKNTYPFNTFNLQVRFKSSASL